VLARKYLQNEAIYTLNRNQRVRGNHNRKTKAFLPLHIMQAESRILAPGKIGKSYRSKSIGVMSHKMNLMVSGKAKRFFWAM